ncbi:MAG: 23S rRNA (pseudouridine(1915)-N(3))-methyltransferase RlmH [Blastocatellia bacterium]|nr:23S rRNA (pseudouridine(1915)-N(3))-methyltransferase RlmH [Blastocatellia bacterium]
MRLQIVWIGKTRDRNCRGLIDDYLERIKHFVRVDVSQLKEQGSGADEKRMIAAEGARILENIERDDFVVLLDEQGRQLSSRELAEFLSARQQAGTKRLVLVIGGFAGVSDEVKRRANDRLALSRMTLTHELARVVLTEQIYRALSLLAGLPYHKF